VSISFLPLLTLSATRPTPTQISGVGCALHFFLHFPSLAHILPQIRHRVFDHPSFFFFSFHRQCRAKFS
jgi:hypothetical protein